MTQCHKLSSVCLESRISSLLLSPSPSKSTLSAMLLLLLSRFSCVRLLATPWTAAHQAPPSMGFSRQEYWSGLPLPSPMHDSEVAQLCPTLSNPMDCSPPGSSIHGFSRQEYWSGVPLGNHNFYYRCYNKCVYLNTNFPHK